MKTDRRGFLGRALAAAATVVGVSAAPKAAEAAVWAPDFTEADIAPMSGYEMVLRNTAPTGNGLRITPWPEPFTGTLESGTYMAPSQLAITGTIRGAGIDQTTIVHAPTFEAMQADCESRGCHLDWQGTSDAPAILTHVARRDGHKIVNGYDFPMIDARADAWRRALHESA